MTVLRMQARLQFAAPMEIAPPHRFHDICVIPRPLVTKKLRFQHLKASVSKEVAKVLRTPRVQVLVDIVGAKADRGPLGWNYEDT